MKYKLLNGESMIYIATRLFNIFDKISSNTLEQVVYKILRTCASKEASTFHAYPLYLPYRDTNEDQLQHNDDAFRAIYDADINRLENLYALIGYLDDPSKDDGICMEIGYAFANSVPIILLSSDIQCYRINRELPYHSDPVIHRMATDYIYMPDIPASKYKVCSDCESMEIIAQEYKERLLQAEKNILKKLETVIERLYYRYDTLVPMPINIEFPRRSVCIDMIGGRYEWTKLIECKITDALKENGITYYVTRRFCVDGDDINSRGEKDIQKLLSSEMLVVCADGAETDAGASALIGMAKKLRKYIILYYSSKCDILEGSNCSLRNLMVELSANSICSTYKDVIDVIIRYCR